MEFRLMKLTQKTYMQPFLNYRSVENCKLRIAMLNMSVPVVSEEYADGERPFYEK